MSRIIWWLIAISAIGIFVAVIYHAIQKTRPEPRPAPAVVAPPAPTPPTEPRIHFPIQPESREKPLPALNESDAAMKDALGSLWSDQNLEQFFFLKDFIRRVVATIDNLPRRKLALRLMPVKKAGGKVLTTGKDGNLAISPDNAARYVPYVRLADAIDATKVVALYV